MEKHTTVLLKEAVDALAITPKATIVDATFGAGGHAREILARLGEGGRYIGIDADSSAIEAGKHTFVDDSRVHLITGNFRHIGSILNTEARPDGILADLGWRMEQFSGNGKGFSFQHDENLIMTYGEQSEYPFTASDIVNEWDEEHIRTILEAYGEERYANRIARAIVSARSHGPLTTTFDLVRVIEGAVPGAYRHGRVHPATRTFQALRIAVNDELAALSDFIRESVGLLADGGRLAIITFHSLEDRIVKHTFRDLEHDHHGTVLTKKPITPTRDEVTENRRARSAHLRIFLHHETSTE